MKSKLNQKIKFLSSDIYSSPKINVKEFRLVSLRKTKGFKYFQRRKPQNEKPKRNLKL